MPPADRLQLATLILNDIPPQAIMDYSEEWSEEDIREVSLYSFQHAAASFCEED